MAEINYSLKDIVGVAMGSREGVLVFYLNEPGIQATVLPGEVNPTAEVESVPNASTGEGVVDLRSTTTMLNDNFYRLRIEWLDKDMPSMDFPNWQIRVPGGGPHLLSELITIGPTSGSGGGSGANGMLWWVSLSPPPSRQHVWLYLDPEDPDRETGPNPDLTLGDIVFGGW